MGTDFSSLLSAIMPPSYVIPSDFDPSRHLSLVAKRRGVSPLKGMQKYLGTPGLLSMAGGLPNPDYFPFDELTANVLAHDQFPITPIGIATSRGTLDWLWNLFVTKPLKAAISVPKYSNQPDDIQLSTALQYQMAKGIPHYISLCREIVAKIHKPGYSNWEVLADDGNTDGWAKCVQTFCNPGEAVLYDEWTYPSALAAMKPYGVSAVPVAIDQQGMCSNNLREILESWDDNVRGSPRPHLMYIVPIGQNPTGATMGVERKQAIYDICVEYDVLIVEDDPYFFLQLGDYLPPAMRSTKYQDADQVFIDHLSPSFLRFDHQGRVIRLETFSKTIAPGCRLGWTTCAPLFAERLERASETSTQAPCGFSQVLVTTLLEQWKYEGYIRWLHGLAVQYARRRTLFVDLLMQKFDIEIQSPCVDSKRSANIVYSAYQKLSPYAADIEKGRRPHIFTFTPPTSGMFVWLKFNLDGHRRTPEDGDETTETLFWISVVKEGLLIGPGGMFAADQSVAKNSTAGHFRISFSTIKDEEMIAAVNMLAKAVDKFYA
ncbi:PLP-dependent transferase [Crepidotus variabilis]|uniref:PLP-dependent transferase n=1 Tax=Crepidotus variabilis TaxID=179855 RepID=A0A9P6ETZ7_9AGAR|nr:PLP-dependent transferase [Crepidotus variabilis]